MRKASVHFKPVKSTSEQHNYRRKEYDYVVTSRSKDNESWSEMSVRKKRVEIEKKYKDSVGQKMQERAIPIREGVIVLQKHHTLEDVAKVADKIEEELGIHCFQIHIHHDEGKLVEIDEKDRFDENGKKRKREIFLDENGQPLINYHGHMLFDWTDQKGKSVKFQKQHMSRMQDIVSEELKMERGVAATESKRRHLDPIEYKARKQLEEIELTIEKKEKLLKSLLNESDHSDEEIKKNNMIPTNALGVVNKPKVERNMKILIETINKLNYEKEKKEDRIKLIRDIENKAAKQKLDNLRVELEKSRKELVVNKKIVRSFVNARKGDMDAVKHAERVCKFYEQFDLEQQQKKDKEKGRGKA